jgi:hypothetical protein
MNSPLPSRTAPSLDERRFYPSQKKIKKKFAGRQNPLNRSIFLYPNSQNFIRETWGLRMSITKEFFDPRQLHHSIAFQNLFTRRKRMIRYLRCLGASCGWALDTPLLLA